MKLYKFIFVFCLLPLPAFALSVDEPLIQKFIEEMVKEHQFDKTSLNNIFAKVQHSQSVLDAISKPAEKKLTWKEYRKIFLDEKRSLNGVEFWKKHRADLERAYQLYGVPPEMIIAILGVETRYGKFTGRYKVIDSLSTLALYYPKRAKFFRKQLKEFLLLTRHQNVDPFSLEQWVFLSLSLAVIDIMQLILIMMRRSIYGIIQLTQLVQLQIIFIYISGKKVKIQLFGLLSEVLLIKMHPKTN